MREIEKTEVPVQLYSKVRPLMVCEPRNPSKVEEWGLFLRPKEIRAITYKQDYTELLERLKSLE